MQPTTQRVPDFRYPSGYLQYPSPPDSRLFATRYITSRIDIFIQDFVYRITQRQTPDVLLQSQANLTNLVHANAVTELSASGPYTITMRSSDDFQQEDKELQKANLQWPRFEIFESRKANNLNPKITIETNRGIPDYIFLRLERINTDVVNVVSYEPVIRTLKFEILNQDIKIVPKFKNLTINLIYKIMQKYTYKI